MGGTSASSSGHSLCVETEVVHSHSVPGIIGFGEQISCLVRSLEREDWGPGGLGKRHVLRPLRLGEQCAHLCIAC